MGIQRPDIVGSIVADPKHVLYGQYSIDGLAVFGWYNKRSVGISELEQAESPMWTVAIHTR